MRPSKLLLARADAGQADSQHKLGKLLLAHSGVASQREAITWLIRASETDPASDSYAFDAGLALWLANEKLRDCARAKGFIEASANLGNVDAMYFLASELAQGEELPRNEKKAFYWYRRAGKKGHAEAQYNLAIMFLEGDGITKDLDKFMYWIRKSAVNGETLAIQTLVNCYREGMWGFRKSDRWMRFWKSKVPSSK